MSKRLIVLFLLVCMVVGLAGCKFSVRDTVEGKEATLPPLRIDSSLICSVTFIEGNRCQVVVLEGSGNYDPEDTLWVTYQSVAKDSTLRPDDVITFTFNYVTDVSSLNNLPHIAVEEITVLEDYVPPVTQAQDTQAAE